MIELVQDFVACLRAAGQRVSTSEVLDCTRQLQHVDILAEEEFRAVLRSNFAKSRREQSRFDELYRLFFHELHLNPAFVEQDDLNPKIEDVLELLKAHTLGEPAFGPLLDFLAGEPLGYLEEIRAMQTRADEAPGTARFNLGPLADRLEIMIKINTLRDAVMSLLEADPSRFSFSERSHLRAHFTERLEKAFRVLTHEPRPYQDTQALRRTHKRQTQDLLERPFAALSPREVEQMRQVVEQLIRRLKDIVGLRYARRKHGMLDVKKTVRQACSHDGVPFELYWRSRPPRKARIVTLCDVSSSVWSAARFMLSILYSLQECFAQVKSYIFVAELAEVTAIFENHEINTAITKVLSETEIDYLARTDYGETFRQFRADCMDVLTPKTTLIIIGDGRTNYHNPREEILEQMRDRCRRIIWLNPDPENTWYTGDSEMLTYQPYCNEVRACRNLNQLMDFIRELVL